MASTLPDQRKPSGSRPHAPEETALLAGWGITSPSAASVQHPIMRREIAGSVDAPPPRGVIARGLGRSYGDQAQNAGGRIIDTTMLQDIDLDPETGIVTATAGTSIDTLIRVLVPRGFFVPVTPGTRFVTVGGAIAADIHGKNHHTTGSWCNHVLSLRLLVASGEILEITPQSHPDLFWATAGGLGLTGIVIDATFRCPRVETSRLLVETRRTQDLDEIMALMRDDDTEYSVAWIDLMARGRSMGRSVLTRGRFAKLEELPRAGRRTARAYKADVIAAAPPLMPSVINRASVLAFNEVWFRKAPKHRDDELQTIPTFFHPLDMVGHWYRVYGPAGFVQWQFALPFDAEPAVRHIVDRLSASGCISFLAVLKTFGPANDGHLSFPIGGWTLALDVPAAFPGLAPLLDELDERIVEAGGRIYLAKDSRVRAELLPAMYPRLDEWREVRAKVDPDGVLQSDLSRRLGLS
jgi:decaprenylphospho-beta-D-ribofuranose 2-oxidase